MLQEVFFSDINGLFTLVEPVDCMGLLFDPALNTKLPLPLTLAVDIGLLLLDTPNVNPLLWLI